MNTKRFWETNINPITGWRVNRQEEQLSRDIVRINKHRVNKRNQDNQIDLEDMINQVVELETFNTNDNEQ